MYCFLLLAWHTYRWKPQLVALSKCDLNPDEDSIQPLMDYLDESKIEFFKISGLSGEGCDGLVRALDRLLHAPEESEEPEKPGPWDPLGG